MHSDYADIRSRIAEEPTWYSLMGVPRYGEPPEDVRAFVKRIRCQACGKIFKVCLVDEVYKGLYGQTIGFSPCGPCPEDPQASHGRFAYQGMRKLDDAREWVDLPLPEHWDYGDPPCHDCVGDTMSSEAEWEWKELE
jgi:hypothetical protein